MSDENADAPRHQRRRSARSRVVQLRASMVEEWTDERALGHGWFVLLRAGFSFDPFDPEHREQSYGTKREALEANVYDWRW